MNWKDEGSSASHLLLEYELIKNHSSVNPSYHLYSASAVVFDRNFKGKLLESENLGLGAPSASRSGIMLTETSFKVE